MSLRSRLLLLLLGGIGPLVVSAVAGVLMLSRTYQHETISAGMGTARALSTALDNELARAVAMTQTLAQSFVAVEGDLPRFEAYAQRMVDSSGNTLGVIALLSPEGDYLASSRMPPGAALPRRIAHAEQLGALSTRNLTQVGNLQTSQVTGLPVFPVRSATVVDGKVRYVVSATVRVDVIQSVVSRQQTDVRTTLAILDANHTIVARSRDAERFVGRQATDTLRRLLATGPSGFGRSTTQEGRSAFTFYATSPTSGWTAVIGQPQEEFLAGRNLAFSLLLVGVVLSSALGITGAVLLARTLLRPIDQLRAAAQELGSGQEVGPFQTSVSELAPVYEALRSASLSLREKHALEEHLLATEQERRRASQRESRSKDEYLATLSHELRNPMAAIGNALHVLTIAPHGRVRDGMLEIANRQFEHLRYLVDDLLELSRIMSGKVALHPTRFDLAECVRNACQALQAGEQFAQREIVLDLQPAMVHADIHRLQQVATNLVANACKYSPPDRPVRVRVGTEGPRAVLEVADQGIGMDAQTLEHAFDLFYQAAHDGPQGGLGVGLALCRKLVEMQDGSIQAWSDGPGKGSRLVVALPLADAAPPAAGAVPPA